MSSLDSSSTEKSVFRFKRACLICRQKRIKCSRTMPCESCIANDLTSVCYSPSNEQTQTILNHAADANILTRQNVRKPGLQKQNMHSTPESSCPSEGTRKILRTCTILPALPIDQSHVCNSLKLPELWICRAACMILLNVPWNRIVISRDQIDAILDHIENDLASLAEVAFMSAVLSHAGLIAPKGSVLTSLPSFALRKQQELRVEAAELFVEQNRQLSNKENMDGILLSQTLLLCSIYWYDSCNFERSRAALQRCIDFAQSHGGLQTDAGYIKDKSLTQRCFENDVYILDAYTSFRSKTSTLIVQKQIAAQEIDCLPIVPTSYLEDQSAIEWQYVRLKTVDFALEINALLSDKLHCEEFFKSASAIDQRLVAHMQSPIVSSNYVEMQECANIEDEVIARAVHMSHTTQSHLKCLRMGLLQACADRCQNWLQISACRGAALHTALELTRSLPLSIKVLQSPWRSLSLSCSLLYLVDLSMSIMAASLGKMFISSPKRKTVISPADFGIVAKFVDTFDQTLRNINYIGNIGPSTFQCCSMLKRVPIHAPPQIPALHEDHADESGAAANIDNAVFSDSNRRCKRPDSGQLSQ